MTMSKSANEIKIHCTLFGPQNKNTQFSLRLLIVVFHAIPSVVSSIYFPGKKKELFDAGQSSGAVIGILEQGTNHLFHFIRSEMGGQRTFAG